MAGGRRLSADLVTAPAALAVEAGAIGRPVLAAGQVAAVAEVGAAAVAALAVVGSAAEGSGVVAVSEGECGESSCT